jgi:molybdate transport system ATP-binding protein
MTLSAEIQVARSEFRLSLELTVAPGEVVALLGPNGAGKTTALRALAGLLPLEGGEIVVDGVVWDRPPSVFLRPEARPVGVVFQDYLLFARMTAVENVAFGLRARGMDRRGARRIAFEWLERVGLAEYGGSRPGALSGGQAQRVALARALATSPSVLLLDEPLAALDAGSRLLVRTELGRHLGDYRGRTLLVTHDPLDAMVLADRLVIVERGQVVQVGAPAEVARQPRTEYVAQLVGLNLYRGKASGTLVVLDDGGSLTTAAPADGAVHVAFSPSAVSLHSVRPLGSPRNVWEVVVVGVEQHAHTVRVRLGGSPSVLVDVTTGVVAELRLVPGVRLWAALKATEVRTYPA